MYNVAQGKSMARARLRWLADESQNSQRESALEIDS